MNKNKKEWEVFEESEIAKLSSKTGIPMYLKRKWYEMSWWEWTLTIIFSPIMIPLFLILYVPFYTLQWTIFFFCWGFNYLRNLRLSDFRR